MEMIIIVPIWIDVGGLYLGQSNWLWNKLGLAKFECQSLDNQQSMNSSLCGNILVLSDLFCLDRTWSPYQRKYKHLLWAQCTATLNVLTCLDSWRICLMYHDSLLENVYDDFTKVELYRAVLWTCKQDQWHGTPTERWDTAAVLQQENEN